MAEARAATTQTTAPGTADPRRIVTQEPFNCESALEHIDGWITPTPLHFVRSSHVNPSIDHRGWRLRIEGESVERPVELSLDQIRAMPSRSQVVWLECAGNHRSFFEAVQGKPVDAAQLPWNIGAVGNAEWTGVSLIDVLELAGVRADAVDVLIESLDEGKRGRPIPIDVARRPSTILAYAMNGAPLSADHGAPVRAIVPGWIGMASVKWVGRIEISPRPIKLATNTTTYILEGPDYPEPVVLTEQPLKSVAALPIDAVLKAGPQTIRGFAWSPKGRIAAVEYSLDGGKSWSTATLRPPIEPLAWVRWEIRWDAAPGSYRLVTRAIDEAGNRQPDAVPWNRLGYLYNAVVEHPFTVRQD
ncbi:MAG: sulfite oxidase [Chloroflexota bacterium]